MDNVENEDWSFIDSCSNHSDWSVVTHDRGSKIYNSGSQNFSIVDDSESSLSTIRTSPSLVWSQMSLPTVMEDYQTELDEYEYDGDNSHANDLRLPEGKMKSKRTSGKRLLKHSLQKRYNGSGTPNVDRIEVCRPRIYEALPSVYYPKTLVDDVLPSLLEDQCDCYGNLYPISLPTSLGRQQRWKTIRELFEELEEQNLAVRVDPRAATTNRNRGGTARGRWSDTPTDIVSYSVQSNGQYVPMENSHLLRHASIGICVYEWRWNGRLKVLYELSSEIPDSIKRDRRYLKPLKASIHLNPDTKIDNQGEDRTQKERIRQYSRKAFVPGVAKVCKANSSNLLRNAQKNVAAYSVDLVFGRAVRVAYLSVAGKVHDTNSECHPASKLEDYRRSFSSKALVHNSTGGRDVKQKWIDIETGHDAYCDKVQISVRLTTNPKRWVSLGVFDACRDGHTETPIYLGRSEVASHHDQTVSCIAIRFRAVSWYDEPLMRVGAYGFETGSEIRPKLSKKKWRKKLPGACRFEFGSKSERMLTKKNKSSKKNKHQDTDPSHQDGNVIYTLYRMKGEANDETLKAKYSVQRKYAIKEGFTYKSHDKGFRAQRKKRPIRNEIKEAL